MLLAGGFGRADFPHPVGRVLVVVVAVLLLILAGGLWLRPIGLRDLAVGNAATALLAAVWLLVGSGFSPAGSGIVAATVAALACLAAAQIAALRQGYPTASSTPASGRGMRSGSSASTSSGR